MIENKLWTGKWLDEYDLNINSLVLHLYLSIRHLLSGCWVSDIVLGMDNRVMNNCPSLALWVWSNVILRKKLAFSMGSIDSKEASYDFAEQGWV